MVRRGNYYRIVVGCLTLLIMLLVCGGIANPGTAQADEETPEKTSTLEIIVNDGNTSSTAATFTMQQLQQMTQVRKVYSAVDSMPAPLFTSTEGVMLKDVLNAAQIDINTITNLVITSTDNYGLPFSRNYLLQTPRYYYPQLVQNWDLEKSVNHPVFKPGVEDGKILVEPILALKSYQERYNSGPQWDLMNDIYSLRFCFGQAEPKEITNSLSMKWVKRITATVDLKNTGSISSITPAVNQVYSRGDNVNISGISRNLTGVTIAVTDPNGQNVYNADNLDASSGSFTGNFALAADAAPGTYTVRIGADNLISAYTVSFLVQNPVKSSLSLTKPDAGQTYKPGDTVNLQGTTQNLATVAVNITNPNGDSVFTVSNLDVSSGTLVAGYTLPADAVSGNYTIKISSASISDYTLVFAVKSNSSSTTPVAETDPYSTLTIDGDGVNTVQFTRSQLEKMPIAEHTYSTTNRGPLDKFIKAKGVSLSYLLRQAGANLANIKTITIIGYDSYSQDFTKKELLDTPRYYYPGLMSDSPDGAQSVDTMVALDCSESSEGFILALGQRAVTEQNNYLFVKLIKEINLSTADPGKWDKVTASPSAGNVDAGTGITLEHSDVPLKVKIYYTTDGSTPGLNSQMFNYYWIDNPPIKIDHDTTIKAIASGAGQYDSDVATFNFLLNKASIIQAGTDNTVSLGDQVQVKIPAGAIKDSDQAQVQIVEVANPPAVPDGQKLCSSVFEFTVDGKSSYSFGSSVTLTMAFDPSALGPGQEAAIYYYDETALKWVKLGGEIENANISVQVNHFTKYAVLVNKKEPTSSQQPGFKDISGHWAEKNIEEMVSYGAISGYPEGCFKPDDNISRAEFATVLVKAFKLELSPGKNFADTSDHWARQYISTAASLGLVSGYDDKTYGPDDLITREEMAVIIARAAKLAPATDKIQFMDTGSISAWAVNEVGAAIKQGIMKGYEDDTFRPQDKATRAEAVTVIEKALQQMN